MTTIEKTGVPVIAGENFFVHLPIATPTGRGMVTASVEISEDLHKMTAGFSFCNPRDAWDRRKGNYIAAGRRKNYRNYATTFTLPEQPTTDKIQSIIAMHLTNVVALYADENPGVRKVAWNEAHTTEAYPRWLKLQHV